MHIHTHMHMYMPYVAHSLLLLFRSLATLALWILERLPLAFASDFRTVPLSVAH